MHNSYRLTRTAVGRIQRATRDAGLYRIAVEEMRRLTGFDRVMVYRFDAEWNGEVIAEDRRPTSTRSSACATRPATSRPRRARSTATTGSGSSPTSPTPRCRSCPRSTRSPGSRWT